jgi:hypothetical protein
MTGKAGAASGSRERIWREALDEWRQSGQSQAAFCRTRGLSENSFSHWKGVIATLDSKGRSAMSGAHKKSKRSENLRTNEVQANLSTPTFVRYAIAGGELADTIETEQSKRIEEARQPVIAGEIVDASSGRRLRIFNGADQATVAILLSALSVV